MQTEPVSCLMVTQPDRCEEIRHSIACFDYQTHPWRELVIVHDGDATFANRLTGLARRYPAADIRIHREKSGQSLGALRNRSLELARYPLVSQWDDDDFYHPERLAMQYRQLQDEQADFCFLTEQLHLFEDKGFLFWDDWSVEAWPGNLIQGSLLGRKDLLGSYPDLARGEDTEVTHRIVQNGHRISTVSDMGWLYIYRYTGKNAWDFDHHAAISRWKRLGKHDLLRQADTLGRELRRYRLPYRELILPHEQGRLVISLV